MTHGEQLTKVLLLMAGFKNKYNSYTLDSGNISEKPISFFNLLLKSGNKKES